MRTRFLALVPAVLAATLALLPAPATRAAEPLPPHVPGEVLVRLAEGVTPESAGIDYSLVREYSPGASLVTLAVPEGRETGAIEAVAGRPGVLYAELNLIAQPAFVPNDPLYLQQWDLPIIGLEEAWDITRGEGVTIAVLDTGVAFEDYGEYGRSPDLQFTLFVDPYDATTGTAHPTDLTGHGTHVTGTLAQDTGNSFETAGVASGAAIMPVKVCAAYGCSSDDMVEGLLWAVDHGADIVSMSLGGPGVSNAEREAYAYAEEHGVVVVAAAGNGGADFVGDSRLDYPGALKTVVAVGAVDRLQDRTHYSNWGGSEGPGHVHMMAPGGDLHADEDRDGYPDGILQSTYAHNCGGETNYKLFKPCYYQGTSMATPHVSGAAALILSRFPHLTPAQVRQLLSCSANDLGPPGIDDEYGSGLVRADKALVDADGDNQPDCIEPPGRLTAVVGDASVVPGGTVGIKVWATITGDGLQQFSVTVDYDRELFRIRDCNARPDVACTINKARITFNSLAATSPITGSFRLGEIMFQAVGLEEGAGTLNGNATARQFYPSQVTPTIIADDGLITIRQVPEALPGDSNCDGVIGTPDILTSLANMNGTGDGFCAQYGDTNCSKNVDIADVLLLLAYLARISPALPVGCPAAEPVN